MPRKSTKRVPTPYMSSLFHNWDLTILLFVENVSANLHVAYWTTKVKLNNRAMSRLMALAIITRNIKLHSEGQQQQSTASIEHDKMEWKGRKLDRRVVEALQQLGEHIDEEIDQGE